MTTLYGISNCDTVRKARAWLDARGIAYAFRDHRRDGVDPAMLADWIGRLGWARVLNRAGTTFRKLPAEERGDLDAARALAIVIAHPSAIRRPVLVAGDTLLAGFEAAAYEAAFR